MFPKIDWRKSSPARYILARHTLIQKARRSALKATYLILSITFALILSLVHYTVFFCCGCYFFFHSLNTKTKTSQPSLLLCRVCLCFCSFVKKKKSKIEECESRKTSWADGTWMFVYIYFEFVFSPLLRLQCTAFRKDNVCCYVIVRLCPIPIFRFSFPLRTMWERAERRIPTNWY